MPGSGHIFISYKSEERDYAYVVRDRLLEWGYDTWLDVDKLTPGEYWANDIDEALKTAWIIVGVMTPAALASRWVTNEWDMAIVLSKPFIPLRFEPTAVHYKYVDIQYADFMADQNAGFSRLKTALEHPEKHIPRTIDVYDDYLNQLFDLINAYLDQKIISSLRDEEKRPEPIQLKSKRTPDAVLFEKRPEVHPLYKIGGIKVDKPSEIYGDFSKAFGYYGGRVLLLGEPGAGKTITLLHFGRDAVVRRMQDPKAPLPILGIVPTWDSLKQPSIAEWLAASQGAPESIKQVIKTGWALLLLDGLDELGDKRPVDPDKPDGKKYDPRLRFIEALNPLCDVGAHRDAPKNGNQILLTCRIQEYRDIGEKIALNGAVTLQPLDSTQMAAYLHAQPELLATIQADDDLRQMLETPLLLSFLAFAYEGMSADERAQLTQLKDAGDLRDKIFETYIRERYAHEARKPHVEMLFTLGELMDILGRLAMNDAVGWGEQNSLSLRDIEKVLDKGEIDAFIDLAMRLDFLVKRDRNTYRFAHLLLRDFLAFRMALPTLSDGYNFDRQRAATALGEIGDMRAVEPLIAVLNDIDVDVRYAAASALGEIGDRRAVEPLIAALNDIDVNIRDVAASGLGNIGDERAIQPLIAALGDNDLDVPDGAITALWQIGELTIQMLLAALNSENDNIRRHSAAVLGEIGDERAIKSLIVTLTDPDFDVRRNAADALGKIGNQEAIQPLIELLSDSAGMSFRRRVCDVAAEGLEKIGTPEALEAVIKYWIRELTNTKYLSINRQIQEDVSGSELNKG